MTYVEARAKAKRLHEQSGEAYMVIDANRRPALNRKRGGYGTARVTARNRVDSWFAPALFCAESEREGQTNALNALFFVTQGSVKEA